MSLAQPSRKRSAPNNPPDNGSNKRVRSSASRANISAPLSESSGRRTLNIPRPVEVAKAKQFFVFGDGGGGELGLGASKATDVSSPRINQRLANVVDLATGGMHGAAISADNRLLTWGSNDEKALGRNTDWDGGTRDIDEDSNSDDDAVLNPLEASPTAIDQDQFPSGTVFRQVAAGDNATFVLTDAGTVYGCGTFRDDNGVFAFTLRMAKSHGPEIVKRQPLFTLITGLANITAICAGADFVLALDSSGQVFAWGPGQQGQLGRRIITRRRYEALLPALVELPKAVKIISIHAGNDHAFAIDSKGDTWAWGLNNFAQTGHIDLAGESEAVIFKPRRVTSLVNKNMLMVRGGRHHSIGVTSAGKCLVWGRMDGGHTGLALENLPLDDPSKIVSDERGRPRILLQPTALPIPDCVFATAGSDHCIAVTREGKAYSWGFNATYQCGQGNTDDINVAKLLNGKAVREIKLCWAGAGGQYSMVASDQDEIKPLANGVKHV